MKYAALLATTMLALAATSCNDDNPGTIILDESSAYSVVVNSFSLEANDSIMANLDSVFFSIDLDNARIFNADSLPVGTRIDALIVKIGLPSVREAKLLVPHSNSTRVDTIDYMTNSTDSVDFSAGPVKLRLVSLNNEVSRDYEICVNVHNVDPSTLSWAQIRQATIPSTFTSPTDLGVAQTTSEVICLTTDGSGFCLATSTDPFASEWKYTQVALPQNAKVSSLRNVVDNLYVVTDDAHLYQSTDGGKTWGDTGAEMTHIYGANGDVLLGVRTDGVNYYHCTYPASVETAVSSQCPVAGTSQPIEYVSAWSPNPTTVVAGGTTATGEYVSSVWGYSGGQWVAFSTGQLPEATEMTVVPYYTNRVGSTWVATARTTLFVFGGKMADGELNEATYISNDRGLNWSVASSSLTLPDEVNGFYGAYAVVCPQTLDASRAVKPITSWDCPYIYLFGGRDAAGTLLNRMWRGVLNRLEFKPIQ